MLDLNIFEQIFVQKNKISPGLFSKELKVRHSNISFLGKNKREVTLQEPETARRFLANQQLDRGGLSTRKSKVRDRHFFDCPSFFSKKTTFIFLFPFDLEFITFDSKRTILEKRSAFFAQFFPCKVFFAWSRGGATLEYRIVW